MKIVKSAALQLAGELAAACWAMATRSQIILKNNVVIEKRIPKKLKYDYISLISEIRRNLLPESVPAL